MNRTAAHSRRDATLTPDMAQRHAPFPLTDIQHAYWIGRDSTFELGNVSCHAYFEWRLAVLDIARLERAWNRIVARHDMLRAIVEPDGRQRILPEVPWHAIPVGDLSDLPAAERDARLLATRIALQQRVPDVARWPLFAIQATRLSPSELRLHIDLDLLTVDVQSFHIILGELERLYVDPDTALPPLELSFRDYVLGRGAFGDAARHAADRAWWMERLPDLPPAPQLPLAVAPHSIARPDFVRRHAAIEAEAWRRFEGFAARRNLTASSALLAAYAEVLAQWSRQDFFCLNLTHFHRERLHPEVDAMVGDFTSVVLVPRSAPEAGAGFAARARQMQKETWAALAHRSFSGIEVIRELGRRDGNGRGTPMPVVFTSLLGLDIDALAAPAGDGPPLLPEPEIVYTTTPQVWFDHQAMVRKDALIFNWITIDALFPEGIVAAMFDAYVALLHRLCEDETTWDAPVPALLPPAQRAARARANAAARDIPLRRLQDGFVAWSAAGPERTALLWREEAWSYGRLAAAAAGMATRLRDAGVTPGGRVVLSLPRGPAQIVTVLGILGAGAAYVPAATDIPAERLRIILEDVGAAAVVTERDDIDWPVLLRPGTEAAAAPLAPAGSPDDLAYILYTSGSTGRPKGVAIRHAAVWNTVADINDRLALGAADRVLALSSLGFDLSVYDIFGPLAAGGAIVLCEEGRHLDPGHWLALLRRHGVTIWNSVPALLDLLLDQAEGGAALPLRAALLSGDWIPLGQPDLLRGVAPDARLLAMGGATEASIWSNLLEVDRVPPQWRSIPYGFPLANQSYRVLDREGRDRPDWVAGNLHIGGAGLAEGYWNDAALTARAFVTAAYTGERLYRTGDLARYWPDGMLEFLGREDAQVKIAGHRIELSEIEAVLAEAPGVRGAVVMVVEREAGARQLAAFVLEEQEPAEQPPPDAAAIVAAAEGAETGAASEPLDRVRGFQAAADRVARIAVTRTLAELDAGAVQPDPRYAALLLRQWRRLPAQTGDLDEACTVLRRLPAWPGAELLAGWIIACAHRAGDLLAGRQAPLELLFPGAGLQHADSLYRHNPAAETLGGVAAAMLAAVQRPGALHVLEVGGGVGSATAPLLPVLEGPGLHYHFTDVSLFFLDAARERFGAFGALSVGRFDINQDPATQELPRESFDLIIASNVLHDAQDLPRTLGWLRGLLAPGGRLLFIEATVNTPVQMITGGFLEGFSAFADFRREAGLPLLDPAQWREVLDRAGFDLLHAAGDRLAIGQHVFLAQRRGGANPAMLRRHAAGRLPSYMVPAFLRVLDRLPLSANGKVDRKALGALLPPQANEAQRGRAPETPTERRLAAIWSVLFATPVQSAEADFFRSGGDSLLAIRLVQRVRQAFGHDLPMRQVFDRPVLADLAAAIDLGLSRGAGDARPLLLLFPGSDGSPQAFAGLETALGEAAEIRALDIASRDPAPFARDPFAEAAQLAMAALPQPSAGRPVVLGGWSSGAVLAAAAAARLEAAGTPVAGLVLLDPVDWRRHDIFAARAQALADRAPHWLRGVVAAQLGALAAFRPVPLSCPALCLWAGRRESGWPPPEPAWAAILAGTRQDLRIATDHWSLLRDADSLAAMAPAVRGFLETQAKGMAGAPEPAP